MRNGSPAVSSMARRRARGSKPPPAVAAVSTSPCSTSWSVSRSSTGCHARPKKVGSRVRPGRGRPARTNASGRPSRCRCCAALPSSLSALSGAWCTSSMVTSTPLASAATTASSTSRTEVTVAGRGGVDSRPTPAPKAWTDETRRPRLGGSCSARRARPRLMILAVSGCAGPGVLLQHPPSGLGGDVLDLVEEHGLPGPPVGRQVRGPVDVGLREPGEERGDAGQHVVPADEHRRKGPEAGREGVPLHPKTLTANTYIKH